MEERRNDYFGSNYCLSVAIIKSSRALIWTTCMIKCFVEIKNLNTKLVTYFTLLPLFSYAQNTKPVGLWELFVVCEEQITFLHTAHDELQLG